MKKVQKTPINTRPKRNATQLYKKLLDFQEESGEDTEDEEDKTFEGPGGKCGKKYPYFKISLE